MNQEWRLTVTVVDGNLHLHSFQLLQVSDRASHTHQLNRVIPSMNIIIKLMLSNWKSLSTDMQCSAAGKLSLSTSAFPIMLIFDQLCYSFMLHLLPIMLPKCNNYAPKV